MAENKFKKMFKKVTVIKACQGYLQQDFMMF